MKSIITITLISSIAFSQKPRARDIGVQFEGTTGKFNAITDVKGVEVGPSTIIIGSGKNEIGKGPVRTGVTAIFPRGKKFNPVYANWYSLNGNGVVIDDLVVEMKGGYEKDVEQIHEGRRKGIGVIHESNANTTSEGSQVGTN